MKPQVIIIAFIGMFALHYFAIKDLKRPSNNPYSKKVFVLNDDNTLQPYKIDYVSPH